jgi:predicted secreted hydrolase
MYKICAGSPCFVIHPKKTTLDEIVIMRFKLYLFVTAVLASHIGYTQDWKIFPYTPAGSVISFPADEGRHSAEPIEWWYTSGHLTATASGKTYSFMLTYFYYPASAFDGFRILNITDDATGKFYQDSKVVNYTSLSADHLDIHASVYNGDAEVWSNKVDAGNKLVPFEYTIKAASAATGLDLDCESLKRPLILGDDGYLEQGISNYTYYYSQTSNAVSGKLTLDGITQDVTGISWIDRQYGNFNPLTGEKYEWFHLQLSNGMDVNLWNIFTTANTIPDNKKYRILTAYVNESSQYNTSDFKIERLGFNWMPDSAMCYSSKWRLTSEENKIDVTITTKNDNTEVQWPFRFYEGATTVSGTVNGNAVTGFGFAELLHSYANPQVTIKNPSGGIYDVSLPVSWQLANPDDGSPVTYDLEYSIDDKATFIPIASGIKDTSYQWINPTISNGDKIWFKITARSADDKLHGTFISASPSVVAVAGADNKIKLFPDPVKGDLFLQPAFQMNNPPCKIVDVNGRVIEIIKSNSISNKIDLSYLYRGVYFLMIDFPGKQVVLKFIKE